MRSGQVSAWEHGTTRGVVVDMTWEVMDRRGLRVHGGAMLQTRTQITSAFEAQLKRFADLVRHLDSGALATPTRCLGWSVADVAGHFTGSIHEIADGNLDGQGTAAVTERQVSQRKGWSAGALADELDEAAPRLVGLLRAIDDATWDAPAGGGFDGSLGDGIEALLFDGVVHSDDIATAAGLEVVPSDEAVVACVSHVVHHLAIEGWGPAVLDLDGVPTVSVGAPLADATAVTGNAFSFVLAATGRADPAAFGLDETVNIYRALPL